MWDLRTFRLLRSVPCLDNTNLVFNSTGDVAYAFLRRTSEDLSTALQARRSRHPLHTAFRTVTPAAPCHKPGFAAVAFEGCSQRWHCKHELLSSKCSHAGWP